MNGLVKGAPHSDMVREIGGQPAIEVGRASLKMRGESPVPQWHIIIFFLVHLFVDDILLGHS